VYPVDNRQVSLPQSKNRSPNADLTFRLHAGGACHNTVFHVYSCFGSNNSITHKRKTGDDECGTRLLEQNNGFQVENRSMHGEM